MRIIFLTIVTLSLAAPRPVSAQVDARRPLQAACFAPADLMAVDGERTPRRLLRPATMRLPEPGDAQAPPVAPALRGAIRRVDLPAGSRKLVALTFDFCEQAHEVAGYDGAVVDTLRRERIPATLFMSGKWMLTHERRMHQLMTDPLFEIATHGFVHRNVRGLTGPDLQREITAPTGAFRLVRRSLAAAQCTTGQGAALAAVPQQIGLTRFAFGACNAESLKMANEAGLAAIQWDVSTGDPSPSTSAQNIVATIVRQTKPGSIVLAHANGRGFHTAAALPAAIQALRSRGFEFVTVGTLLASGRPVSVDQCYDAKPGDTDKYDRLFAR